MPLRDGTARQGEQDDAEVFLTDLASRMANRIQLSTDGHRIYEGTVGSAFRYQVDWAQI